ncbi:MAG: polysaccharide biosynthesis C-terminal domain-containing protein, partial [Lachnospiraceae bacterium]|nr:polysaccharide biosynthesis C-terminal domain-containing protein [Lachnospiraceae bacterium]
SMGAVVAVLFTFSFLFGQILYKMRMVRELFLAASASFAVHLAAAYFLTQRGHLGVEGLLCALILYFGLYMVLAFVFLNRRVKYRPDWLPAVVFPLAAAAVSGLIVYLINLLLSGVAGAAVCILVSLPVGVFFHILFLVLLRVVGEAELHELPLGFLFIAIGRTLGVL